MTGNQVPRIRIEPERAGTDGEGAAMLMAAYGVTLDPWQRLILDCWLGTDRAGAYTVTSAGLSVPRQNGKNICLEARVFYGLVVNGERILWTAHQVRTYKKAFRRLANMFTDKRHPEILKMVKQIHYGIGEESIELINGGIVEFSSRTRQAARGFDGISLVVYDEAQELTDEQIEAITSVLSASATGIRQLLYCGTPPYVGANGEVFQRFRKTCITAAGQGQEIRSAWHEWSVAAEDPDSINIEDRGLWYETNPALGTRLTEEFTEEECRTLSRPGFLRERLGYWSKPIAEHEDHAIDPAAWDACVSDRLKPEGKTAYGVKFTPDGSLVVLAGACIDKQDGKTRISVIDVRPTSIGLVWLADWLNERYKIASCVVVDGRNGADVLIDKIRGVWVFRDSVLKPTAQNVVNAASLLVNALNEQTVTWYRGQAALRESAISATKRSIAGGWSFGGDNAALIEAAALALWGVSTSRRDPTKVMRIG